MLTKEPTSMLNGHTKLTYITLRMLKNKKGHWGADCYLRKNQMNESSPKRPEQFEQPTSQGNGKLCLHCGKPGHLIADCYQMT
ncbi:hypothetical protein BpHYR1_021577 [Brachionus plicatilis]|uniref:CCHC-type domain-containing protein n=1 Tax=Brachionus plicatilis TaxID=10195 RepID=A0A3M7S6K5_BRAPC|nr:hypothetical protein BpHYR1_021577 [Brachionus plicatilis]